MASELACPKCQSENTKKMSQIIRFGTRETEVQIGMRHGFVSETDPLAEELSKGLADALAGEPGGSSTGSWGLFAAILSLISGFFTHFYLERHIGVLSQVAGWIVGISLFVFLCFKIKNGLNSKENIISFNHQKNWLDNGCVCQRCGERYIPGSSEQYNFRAY